jgi:hypothetical protein
MEKSSLRVLDNVMTDLTSMVIVQLRTLLDFCLELFASEAGYIGQVIRLANDSVHK